MTSIEPRRLSWKGLAAVVVVSMAGCGGGPADGFQRFPVWGTVTLDGQPLKSGTIGFIALQQGASSAGEIVEGRAKRLGRIIRGPQHAGRDDENEQVMQKHGTILRAATEHGWTNTQRSPAAKVQSSSSAPSEFGVTKRSSRPPRAPIASQLSASKSITARPAVGYFWAIRAKA